MFKKTIKAIFSAILATPIALMALADDQVTITVWSMDGHDLEMKIHIAKSLLHLRQHTQISRSI